VRHIDLSHIVEDGMVTYRGLPAPKISDFLTREASRARYAPGTEFQIGMIEMCSNTGTYVDSPAHRYAGRADLAALELDRLADVDAVVIDASSAGRSIGLSHLEGIGVGEKAVLIRTGWDRHWRTEAYFTDHPFLTADAARYLVEQQARIVGIDSFNIDDVSGGDRPVHSILLAADIPICEHLTSLAALPAQGFRFSAVPVKVSGMGTFPVRAYATLP
jgi:kynurenine formamidase